MFYAIAILAIMAPPSFITLLVPGLPFLLWIAADIWETVLLDTASALA
jgi:hypothetical protein